MCKATFILFKKYSKITNLFICANFFTQIKNSSSYNACVLLLHFKEHSKC